MRATPSVASKWPRQISAQALSDCIVQILFGLFTFQLFRRSKKELQAVFYVCFFSVIIIQFRFAGLFWNSKQAIKLRQVY